MAALKQKESAAGSFFKGRKPEAKTGAFHSTRFVKGGLSALTSILVLVIAVVINLIAGAIPATYTKFDISSAKYYTLSEQTKEIVKGLEDEVSIYFLTEPDHEDVMIRELLKRYDMLSDKISVELIDTILYPNFSKQYTEDPLDVNTVIVAGPDNSKIVEYGDIYLLNYGLYYLNGTYEYDFDGEGQITSAIQYVTNKNPDKIYQLTGHGEAELSYPLQNALEKQNSETAPLNLLTEISVPEDADCLMVISPETDLSDAETRAILDYMGKGGNLLLITDYAEEPAPNIGRIMEYNGLKLVDGIVFEGNAGNSIKDHNNYLLPNIQFHDINQSLINHNYNLVLPNAQAAKEMDAHRSTLNISPLLTSSDAAYSKVAGYRLTTRDKEPGDIDGPFILGVLVTEEYNDAESRFIWFGSGMLLDEAVDDSTSGANSDLFLNSLAYMSEYGSNITIHSKSMEDDKIVLSTSQSVLWSILLIIVLPLAILVSGFIVWFRRRRK